MSASKETWWDRRKTGLEIIAAIAVLWGIVWGAGEWIEKKARDAVTEEKFLSHLSGKVRPTCIFDSRGVIEADLGTSDYLEEIKVTPTPAIYGFEILVKAKVHLAYAPLVSGIDADLFSETVSRQAPHGWRYKMTPNSPMGSVILEDEFPSNKVFRFKLEILH